jgi:hypothetical protein
MVLKTILDKFVNPLFVNPDLGNLKAGILADNISFQLV